ncbi:DUF411 domain-containing protein [Pseudoxanthomonas sp. CAU 1598]|uniref:DUF411 domain-containing protein n=1 Tax=Pseudomarimonas arenosa TaxID=2774145 RepID=A0AAW3ZI67_9GAMM|nr:DUF411 domain-containing protein [Pseudomarimonas arenosa]
MPLSQSWHALTLGVLLLTTACTSEPDSPSTRTSAASDAPAAASTSTLPTIIVHKTATCGCCSLWVEHLQKAGFTVDVRDSEYLNPVKLRLGVPPGKGSCHTAEVDGYVVEGHVPVGDILRLLNERPKARGLVLPGMPLGSPGMEMPDGRIQPYTVELLAEDGSTSPFQRHGTH